jgi:hypothetical protein
MSRTSCVMLVYSACLGKCWTLLKIQEKYKRREQSTMSKMSKFSGEGKIDSQKSEDVEVILCD